MKFASLIRGAAAAIALTGCAAVHADVTLPNIFGSHMVLQRDQKDPVWGWAEPGEDITVTIADQTKTAKAGADGTWRVTLDPLPVGGPHTLIVKGKNTVAFEDVLVGEVWVCSGQSNMQWNVNISNDPDLEKLTAKNSKIRLVTVPNLGTQEPQKNFNGKWEVCSPETVGNFSAVGYFFGRQLQQTLDVPVGLINNAWGGSACEAWINRGLFEKDAQYKPLIDRWVDLEKKYDSAEGKDKQNMEGKMRGNSRPANIYNGGLKPIIGYGIRGALWYQGESNANRAYQYREMFPLMIKSWREEWGQGDFPFYWVQLADFMNETPQPGDSDWAELREAQTMTLDKLPNTGEAVIIDIGEGRDIHPRNKQDVAKRLSRWALAKIHGLNITHQSPRYESMKKEGNKIVVTFKHVGPGGLYALDVDQPRGFTIAGADKVFHNAQAKITGPNTVEVWADGVAEPAAVRYAWAANPICNLYGSREIGLPVTPFRSDDWKGVTAENK